MRVSLRSRDEFGRLMALGIGVMLFCHVFVNIAMTIGVSLVLAVVGLAIFWAINWPIMKIGLTTVEPWTFRAVLVVVGADRPGADRPAGPAIGNGGSKRRVRRERKKKKRRKRR